MMPFAGVAERDRPWIGSSQSFPPVFDFRESPASLLGVFFLSFQSVASQSVCWCLLSKAVVLVSLLVNRFIIVSQENGFYASSY